MNKFSYTTAWDVEDAVEMLTENTSAKLVGGGTNLFDLMKEGVSHPNAVVDINSLPYNKIEEINGGGLRLGSVVTNADTAYHPLIEERYPLLSKAILAGASPQLRNMATDGGNLMQRTHCYYFYDLATPCNKREPGTGCSAIKGYNRIHAILGWSDDCIATHPSDMCVALAALDATVRVTGSNGERTIPFYEFHRLPGNTPEIDNNLQPNEVITAIELPQNGFAKNFAYLKIRDRLSYAFALVSVAVGLEMDGNIIKEARIALGGVAHKPWRKIEVEQFLAGKEAIEDNYKVVAEMMIDGAQGFEHNSFKIELAKRAIVRALNDAVKMNKS